MSLQRMLLAIGFAICVALMAAALWLQHVRWTRTLPAVRAPARSRHRARRG